jgi:hypothetical protein
MPGRSSTQMESVWIRPSREFAHDYFVEKPHIDVATREDHADLLADKAPAVRQGCRKRCSCCAFHNHFLSCKNLGERGFDLDFANQEYLAEILPKDVRCFSLQ